MQSVSLLRSAALATHQANSASVSGGSLTNPPTLVASSVISCMQHVRFLAFRAVDVLPLNDGMPPDAFHLPLPCHACFLHPMLTEMCTASLPPSRKRVCFIQGHTTPARAMEPHQGNPVPPWSLDARVAPGTLCHLLARRLTSDGWALRHTARIPVSAGAGRGAAADACRGLAIHACPLVLRHR